jgi:hypothetical protein
MTIEIELALSSHDSLTSIGSDKSGSSAGLELSDNFRLDKVYTNAASSDIPDWLNTSSRHSQCLMEMESGKSGYGATATKIKPPPRRTSKKIIGPSNPLEGEIKTVIITAEDELSRRRIRVGLIVGLLFVLLVIFIFVVWSIIANK